MNDRVRGVICVTWFLIRLVLAAMTFLLVGVTIFVVSYGAAAIVTSSSSYDTIIALAIACGLAAGGLASLGVWRLSGRPTNRV